jgi:hypothetical protein
VIDNLGFHVVRDYQTELTQLNREITALTRKVTIGSFYSHEDRHNTYGRLSDLQARAAPLTTELAMETQRLDRLAAAVRIVGDAQLGFIAYVVFGPKALPLEPLYEVRLLDPNGYTVPGTVRSNLPASRVEKTRQELLTVDAKANVRIWGDQLSAYRVQVTPF